MIVTKELHEKQVSLKDTEERLAYVVHAATDVNHAIRHVINQPASINPNSKRNNPSKRQRQMMKKELLMQPPLVNGSRMRSLRHRHTNANVLIDENYSKRRTCN
jgi:hypothetical protein